LHLRELFDSFFEESAPYSDITSVEEEAIMILGTMNMHFCRGKSDLDLSGDLVAQLNGRVVSQWEYNGRDDSDFYVVFIIPGAEGSERYACVEYNTTRFGGGVWIPFDKLTPPSEEEWTKFYAWVADRELKQRWAMRDFYPGETVQIVDGRKMKGKIAKIASTFKFVPRHIQYNKYGHFTTHYVVFEDGTKVNRNYCQIVENPDQQLVG
jgi:hypothetical protein